MASIHQPGRGDVHVDRPLTNISIAFLQSQDAFVADRAFPVLPVQKQTDKYFTLPRGAFFRDEMEKRAPGAEAAASGYDVSTDSYSCDVWALAKDLADQIRANYDSPLDADREVTEFLTLKGLIRKERLWSAAFMTTSVWTTDYTGVSGTPSTNEFKQWNDGANSNPIEDVRAGKRRVQGRTGFRPNVLVLGRQVYDVLLDHPDIVGRLDRGQTSGAAVVMRRNLAELFELDEVMVMDAVYNSAVEGAADSIDFIAPKAALLLYRPSAPGLMTPSAGYTFSWVGMPGSGLGTRIKRIRDEMKESDRVEIQMAFDHKKVSADLGSFFASAIA